MEEIINNKKDGRNYYTKDRITEKYLIICRENET